MKDHRRTTKLIIRGSVVTVTMVIIPAASASGGGIVFDPTNFFQNYATAISAAKQVHQQYTQIENQFKMLENQAINLKGNFTNITDLKIAYSNLMNLDRYVSRIVSDFAQAQAAWDRTYPEFSKKNRGKSASEYAIQAKNVWDKSQEQILNSAKVNALATQNNKLTSRQVEALLDASQTSEGALQVAQLGNKLAGASIAQLQTLTEVAAQGFEVTPCTGVWIETMLVFHVS